jgi:4-hydroxybenzoate polyprenyltransferase
VSTHVLSKLVDQAENQRTSWFSAIFALLSIILLRNFLEGILEEAHSITLLEDVYHSLLINFVHFSSFYLTLFLLVIILLAYLTRESLSKVGRVVVLFSPVILIAPVADLFISRGAGFNLSYPTELSELIHLLLAGPFYRGTITGITPGMRTEAVIAALLVFLYIYGKRKGILKAIVAVIALDLIVAMVANVPLVISLAFEKPFAVLYAPGSLLSSDTQKFGIIYLLLLSATLMLAGLAFLPHFTKTWLKSIRALRSVNYVGAVLFGFLIGYTLVGRLTPFLFDNPWDYLAIASLCIAIFLSFCGAVVLNDICDARSDQVSRRRNPLISKNIKKSDYLLLGGLLYALALLFAVNTSYTSFFLICISILVSFFYSSPPFRLKRIPLLSTFALAFATLLAVILGFSVFAGEKAFFAFPSKLSVLFLVSLTLGFTPKDLVDVEGDKLSGTSTIPVIFGYRAGKIITYLLVCFGYLLAPLLYRSALLLMLSLIFIIVTALEFLLKRVRETAFLATYYLFSILVLIFLARNPEMLAEGASADIGRRFQAAQYLGRHHYQEVYDRFKHSDPVDDLYLSRLIGISAFKVAEYEQSFRFLEAVLRTNPYESDVYSYATNALIKTDSAAVSAVRINALALRRWLDPKRFFAEKGIIDLHRGNTESALRHLDAGYRLGYDESSLLFYLARVLHLEGKDLEAERLLRRLLARNKNDVAVLAELGKLKMQSGDLEEALRIFTRALGVSEHNPLLHNNLGVCYLRLKDFERAAVHFKKALQINPHYLPAQRNLQMLLRMMETPQSPDHPVL